MGKKSLIKSTSKKKRAPKKAAASKNPKKKSPAKKSAAKAKPVAKTAKKEVPKKAAAKAKPISVKDLLKKQFDVVVPKVLYTVPADKAGKSIFTAPDLLAGYDADDAKRIKGLLANTYSEKDLKAAAGKAPAAKATPKKAAPKAKPVSVKDLLKRKFDVVTPEALYTVPADKVEKPTFTAPDLLAGYDADNAKRIKGLLANTYSEKDLKAAAEKAASEKAEAEKAEAEKAAAEKAEAEKAEAEKAAAEKAEAEKAEAEKAAAEKAEAIKKAAAQKSDVKVSYEPAPTQAPAKKPSDPVDNTIKLVAAGLAFLMLLIIGASAANSSKYYLTDNQGTLEIWKGKFAPLGKKKLISLPGVPVPDAMKDVYSADEVYPLAFQYYVDKADALLDVPGIPDFEAIKKALKTALEYGSTNELRGVAYTRLDNIDRLILTYKADVAASRGTIADLNAAVDFLEEADNLTPDEAQKELIAKKIAAHEAAIQQLEEQAAAEQAAAEQAAAEQAAAEQAAAEQAAAEAPGAAEGEAQQADADTEVNTEQGLSAEADNTEAGTETAHAEGEHH